MKLCPQCDFIYEEHQTFCDMDGKELVHNPAADAREQSVSSPTRLSISLPSKLEGVPARSETRRLSVLITVGLGLAALLAALYFVQFRQSRSSAVVRPASQSPAQSDAQAMHSQPLTTAPLSPTLVEPTPRAEPSPAQSTDGPLPSPTKVVAASPFRRARLASSPVSAGAVGPNSRGLVIVRLANGASIKADEAWERREGVWYRQGGMVTFLKHSQVRTIERLAPSLGQPKAAANYGDAKKGKAENGSAQNRLSIRRLEAADTKKQSGVRSFLRMTGRILKKPFKL